MSEANQGNIRATADGERNVVTQGKSPRNLKSGDKVATHPRSDIRYWRGKIFKHGTAEELAEDQQVRRLYLGRNFELKRKDYLHEEARQDSLYGDR